MIGSSTNTSFGSIVSGTISTKDRRSSRTSKSYLAVKSLLTSAHLNSMSDHLCHCGMGDRVQAPERRIPSPALSYEGSNASYHTPPQAGVPTHLPLREESMTNDSNAENAPPPTCWSGFPEEARLIPLTDEIQVWEVLQEGWLEAKAVSDEEDERLRVLRNRRVCGSQLAPHQLIGHQTCVKLVRTEPYPACMVLGGNRGGVRYSVKGTADGRKELSIL